MLYVAEFVPECKLSGKFTVNYMDFDEMQNIDGFEVLTNSWVGSLVPQKTIRGVSFRYRNGESMDARRDFVNSYIPNHADVSTYINNTGSPLFRIPCGVLEDVEQCFFMGACSYNNDRTYVVITNGYGTHNFEPEYTYTATPLGSGFNPLCYLTTSGMGLYDSDNCFNYIALIYAKYENEMYLGVLGFNSTDGYDWVLSTGQLLNINDMKINELEPSNEDEYGDESTEGGYSVGGNPSFDDSSDSILVPNDPSISVSNLGFLNTYKVTESGLSGMIEELFPEELLPIIPDPSGEGFLSDVAHSINALASTVGNVFTSYVNSNLLQYVVDVHVIPVTPSGTGSEHIKVGFKTLETSASKVVHDYVNFDCGTIHVPEYYKNFLDFQSKVSLFVPFVGLVPVNPDMFLGGSIGLEFKFNIIDGSFTAFVKCKSSKSKLNGVCGQYSGNCCVHIPITGASYSNIVSGLVSGLDHAQNMVESKSLSSGSFASGIEAMNNIISKPMYTMSNGFNATSGFMGVRIPYLIISRPVSSFSKAYPHEKGMPLNVTKRLSEMVGTGMTVCDKPHIDFECTEWERAEIERLLTSGVIL